MEPNIAAILKETFQNYHSYLRKGYFDLLQEELQGNNQKYAGFYNKIAWYYNLSNRIFLYFKFGGEGKARSEFLSPLQIQQGDRVLEVSIGTGDNLPYLNAGAEYYGIDISAGMLEMAAKHLKRWHIPAILFRAEAEDLPFRDNVFDVVFHHGGINFFNRKEKAIAEMIRVVKPGGQILISDETEELVEKVYQKNPAAAALYQDAAAAEIPIDLIPPNMEQLKVEVVNQGLIYYIVFRKPGGKHRAPVFK